MSLLIRVRSAEGTLRVQVDSSLTVAALYQQILNDLTKSHVQVAQGSLQLHRTQTFSDSPLSPDLPLSTFEDGDLIFARFVKITEPVKPPPYSPPMIPVAPPCQKHGPKASCIECLLARTIIVTRQTDPVCSGVNIDQNVAVSFQNYATRVPNGPRTRVGVMYGTVTDAKKVNVEFIYEPPQEGTETLVTLVPNEIEFQHVEILAATLGFARIGCIFSRTHAQMVKSTEGQYQLTAAEISLAASMVPAKGQPFAVVTTWVNDDKLDQFEAYEVAQSYFNLRDRKYFLPLVTGLDEDGNQYDDEELFYLKPEAHVRIGPTAVSEVESSYFIVNVPIAQHTSSLQLNFPVENRNEPQYLQYLATILHHSVKGTFEQKMADFHLLLFMAKEIDISVVTGVAEAISNRCAIPEGYRIIIESMTGQ